MDNSIYGVHLDDRVDKYKKLGYKQRVYNANLMTTAQIIIDSILITESKKIGLTCGFVPYPCNKSGVAYDLKYSSFVNLIPPPSYITGTFLYKHNYSERDGYSSVIEYVYIKKDVIHNEQKHGILASGSCKRGFEWGFSSRAVAAFHEQLSFTFIGARKYG